MVVTRGAVSNVIAAALLVVGILIGLTGYYVATTYQTKTVTDTQTTTVDFTSTQIQTSVSTSTLVRSTTSTTTSYVTSTSTTSIYPVPTNVTVAFVMDDGAYQYQIDAGPNQMTSTPSSNLVVPLMNLYQGEQVSITTSSVGDRVGETVTVELFVNGLMVG